MVMVMMVGHWLWNVGGSGTKVDDVGHGSRDCLEAEELPRYLIREAHHGVNKGQPKCHRHVLYIPTSGTKLDWT